MNPDYEQQLEARIDRELKQLGELSAPTTLASRVMRVIEQRAVLPWYRRSWQTWPLGLQAVSLAVLLAMFGGLCWGAWELTRAGSMTAVAQKFAGEFADLDVIWRTLGVLGNALVLAIQNLGYGIYRWRRHGPAGGLRGVCRSRHGMRAARHGAAMN